MAKCPFCDITVNTNAHIDERIIQLHSIRMHAKEYFARKNSTSTQIPDERPIFESLGPSNAATTDLILENCLRGNKSANYGFDRPANAAYRPANVVSDRCGNAAVVSSAVVHKQSNSDPIRIKVEPGLPLYETDSSVSIIEVPESTNTTSNTREGEINNNDQTGNAPKHPIFIPLLSPQLDTDTEMELACWGLPVHRAPLLPLPSAKDSAVGSKTGISGTMKGPCTGNTPVSGIQTGANIVAGTSAAENTLSEKPQGSTTASIPVQTTLYPKRTLLSTAPFHAGGGTLDTGSPAVDTITSGTSAGGSLHQKRPLLPTPPISGDRINRKIVRDIPETSEVVHQRAPYAVTETVADCSNTSSMKMSRKRSNSVEIVEESPKRSKVPFKSVYNQLNHVSRKKHYLQTCEERGSPPRRNLEQLKQLSPSLSTSSKYSNQSRSRNRSGNRSKDEKPSSHEMNDRCRLGWRTWSIHGSKDRSRYGSADWSTRGSIDRSTHGSIVRSRNGSKDRSTHGSEDWSTRGLIDRSRHGSIGRSTCDSIDQSTHGSNVRSTHGSEDRSRHGSEDGSTRGSIDRSRSGSIGRSICGSQDRSRHGSEDGSTRGSIDRSRSGSIGRSICGSQDRSRHISEDGSTRGSIDRSRSGSIGRSKCGSLSGSRHGSEGRSTRGSTSRSRYGPRDRSRDSSTNRLGHETRDQSKYSLRDRSRRGSTNRSRHSVSDRKRDCSKDEIAHESRNLRTNTLRDRSSESRELIIHKSKERSRIETRDRPRDQFRYGCYRCRLTSGCMVQCSNTSLPCENIIHEECLVKGVGFLGPLKNWLCMNCMTSLRSTRLNCSEDEEQIRMSETTELNNYDSERSNSDSETER